MEGPPSDATLLARVAERDIGAPRALYERHAGWLALRLARRCNDRDLVAAAVQDTFVAVWQKPRSVRAVVEHRLVDRSDPGHRGRRPASQRPAPASPASRPSLTPASRAQRGKCGRLRRQP